MTEEQQAIARAQIERDELLEECFQSLYQISKKSCCLKLLQIAREHLLLLAGYKSNRSQRKTS